MAEYYKGRTIDPDENGPFLKIEGDRYPYKEVDGECCYDYDHEDGKKAFCKGLHGENPICLGIKIIKKHPSTKRLEEERSQHIIELKKGVTSWNEWRINNPHIRPILYDLDYEKIKFDNDIIKSKGLQGINFSNANLINADLRSADLTKANFHEANLGGAKLIKAILIEANFCRTDFYKTDLSGANLFKANLQGSQIAETIFKEVDGNKTQIKECKVYGSSAWDIKGLDEATQEDLEIVYKIEENMESIHLKVNDLRMAQFLYFILNNKNLSKVFKATHSSVVLILGRFTEGRKEVLDMIRKRLGDKFTHGIKYIPIIFDFDKSEAHGYTEVTTVLAGISRFIIADLTNPSSIAQELHAIVGEFRTPVIPIIEISDKNKAEPFSMFVDYYKYNWVHSVIQYSSTKNLSDHFPKLIVEAEKLHEQMMSNRSREQINSISIENL